MSYRRKIHAPPTGRENASGVTQVTAKWDLREDTARADPGRYLRTVTAGFDGPADKQRKESNMQYPGRIIKTGERDPEIIRALKTQLNQALGT